MKQDLTAALPPASHNLVPPSHRDIGFISHLARDLHAFGIPAHRLEDIMVLVAERLGYRAQCFVLPTGIIASFCRDEEYQTYLFRVKPGGIHLDKQCQVDEIANQVMRGEIDPVVGAEKLNEVDTRKSPYPSWMVTLTYGVVAAAVVTFFNGGWPEVWLSLVIGTLIGLTTILAGYSPNLERIHPMLAAFTAALLANLGAAWFGPLSPYVCTVSSLIVLVPGLTLTVAMNELATTHLASGTARLSGALVVFLQIGFGVALGVTLAGIMVGETIPTMSTPLPLWSKWFGALFTSLSFVILFQGRRRDIWLFTLAGMMTFSVSSTGMPLLGQQLGTAMAGLATGCAANLFARIWDRPASLIQVPGIIILVPGAIGFQSVSALLKQDLLGGFQTGFNMVMVALSIVAGLLLSSFLIPPRKAL